MLTYSGIAFVQTVLGLLFCPALRAERVIVIVPWTAMDETHHGPTMGSSFMIAMKRHGYNVPFGIIPLRCDDTFLVISQVPALCHFNVRTTSQFDNTLKKSSREKQHILLQNCAALIFLILTAKVSFFCECGNYYAMQF